jgi:phage FluMu gp28-like protein
MQPDAASVLLPYQQKLLATVAANAVTVCEKSRRIGATWGIGAQSVLTAGAARSERGMDVLYIGYNLDMAREFIGVCAMWAGNFALAAGEVREFLFADQARDGQSRGIAAFRISFASGFEIVALASRPRSLRGRQGFVIIDEAAFHEDLSELLKAALALLIWGGKVLVISTHDGAENPFAEMVNDIRSGRRPFALLRITFDDALADGLFRRISQVRGLPWSEFAEQKWVEEIRAFYGDGAAEELDVIPRAGGSRFLPLHLIEARASREIPVLRWACDDAFVHLPDLHRAAAAERWCEGHLGHHLRALNPLLRSAFGVDFGRLGDLSVVWPVQVQPDLSRSTPFTVELRNVPFEQQRQVVHYVADRLPRLSAGALDATGNGAWLAEVTAQRYGAHRIEQVKLSEGWYRDHMPRLKAGFEDGTFDIPADAATVEDFRSLEMVRGVARVPERRSQAKGEDRARGGQRHGDAAIAAALAIYAAGREVGSADLDQLPMRPLPRHLADYVTAAGRRGGLGDFLG